jgi:ATP-dependent Clp protease ATP-binding subunit ClpA
VGTEQILLGLIGTGPELANQVLMEFGVNLDDARKKVNAISGRGWPIELSKLKYTSNAKQIIQTLARNEAAQLGKQSVNTEHLLLALLTLKNATANQILESLEVDLGALQKRLLIKIATRIETCPPQQSHNLEHQERFDRFSPEAKRAVLTAQEKAKQDNLSYIDSNAILYGLLSLENNRAAQVCLKSLQTSIEKYDWQFQKKATYGATLQSLEIPISLRSLRIFGYAGRVAEHGGNENIGPEHLLFSLICWSDLARQIIDNAGGDTKTIETELSAMLKLERSYFPAINAEVRKKDPRSLNDWFHPDARQTIQRAVEVAKERKSSLVSTYDLHVALADRLSDVPEEAITKTRPAPELGKRRSADATPDFSPEVLSVFVEAQKGSDTPAVRSKDLLIGYLSLAAEGKLAGLPHMPSESWEELRNQVFNSDYPENKPASLESESPLPLEVNDHTVRITKRLQRVLANAKLYMKHSHVGKVGINHLLLALLDEAENSEIKFVRTRESEFRNARAALVNLKSDRRVSRELLTTIMNRAVLNAKRLNSRRLDLNHLALALLEETHAAVNIMIAAVESHIVADKARRVLKSRLDQCMVQQSGNAHQTEPGEQLDLSDIYESL